MISNSELSKDSDPKLSGIKATTIPISGSGIRKCSDSSEVRSFLSHLQVLWDSELR